MGEREKRRKIIKDGRTECREEKRMAVGKDGRGKSGGRRREDTKEEGAGRKVKKERGNRRRDILLKKRVQRNGEVGMKRRKDGQLEYEEEGAVSKE